MLFPRRMHHCLSFLGVLNHLVFWYFSTVGLFGSSLPWSFFWSSLLQAFFRMVHILVFRSTSPWAFFRALHHLGFLELSTTGLFLELFTVWLFSAMPQCLALFECFTLWFLGSPSPISFFGDLFLDQLSLDLLEQVIPWLLLEFITVPPSKSASVSVFWLF